MHPILTTPDWRLCYWLLQLATGYCYCNWLLATSTAAGYWLVAVGYCYWPCYCNNWFLATTTGYWQLLLLLGIAIAT